MQPEPTADPAATPRRAFRMGLVGRGIQLSRTPAMHEAEAAALGLACRYELIDTDTGPARDLPEILSRAEAEGFAGLNVTFPYKQEVMAHLDHLSDAARRVGAVNTVVFHEGQRFGHNTDFWGFKESLRVGLPDAPLDDVLLIGAGGAGGALAHALADAGAARIRIHDTRDGAAASLARGLAVAEPAGDLADAATHVSGIVNATPVGMAKLPGMPIAPPLLHARHWVADIIYFPLETELLRTASSLGCRTLGGEGMAVFQAVRAFQLFTGRTADADRMRATFRSLGAT
ncbi:shikimate dehydrogenase [Palleronia salina]|uniref:Shikimate dehydrogenase (NADP(+)) n=1 Tax=Palleronia salina TaxID=313368 RepID=A0A1M6ICQ4_9RHOB|nr:shikimate dehydrogenase [Palleronia salina]SHJ32238.1 shikimate dehydrogenase [Palleronia salina]